MAVVRIEKTKDYTVMSNTHFREKEMSLKAKGLLSLMLSLPDCWDYSIEGLVSICAENETAIKSTLNELKKFGYLEVIKLLPNQTESGRIEYIYNVFESPKKQEVEKQEVEKQGVENLGVEFLGVEIQAVENQGQYNTNKLNTKELKKKKENTKELNTKHIYGEYKNVRLTDTEFNNLVNDFGNDDTHDAIKYLDEYIEMKGTKYKSHYLAMRKWVFDAIKRDRLKNSKTTGQQSQLEAIFNA